MSGLIGTRAASRFSYKRMDTDATAFVTAASITDRVQKAVVNHYVRRLKFTGIWTKTIAVYPFIGATAAAHKFNLRNPADTDVAFRMIFSGTWTHDVNGGNAVANTSALADTKVNATSNLTTNNVCVGYYAHNFGNLQSSNLPEFGASTSASNRIVLAVNFSGQYIFDSYTTTARCAATSNSLLGQFMIGNRTASNAMSMYRGDMIGSNLSPSTIITLDSYGSSSNSSPPNSNVFINGVVTGSNMTVAKTYPFAFACNANLTPAQVQAIYNICWYAQFALRRMAA